MPALPPLVSPEDLRAALDGPGEVLVLDASTALAQGGEGDPYTAQPLRAQYLDAHVPGAAFVDVLGELSDPDGPFLFTLPSADALAAAFAAVGVGDDTHVVVPVRQPAGQHRGAVGAGVVGDGDPGAPRQPRELRPDALDRRLEVGLLVVHRDDHVEGHGRQRRLVRRLERAHDAAVRS